MTGIGAKPSTQHTKAFCSACGSALPNLQMGGDLLMVPAGSLDGDVPIFPRAHIFVSCKANWDKDLEKIPRFDNCRHLTHDVPRTHFRKTFRPQPAVWPLHSGMPHGGA